MASVGGIPGSCPGILPVPAIDDDFGPGTEPVSGSANTRIPGTTPFLYTPETGRP